MESHKLTFYVLVFLKLWIIGSLAIEYAPVVETTKGKVRGGVHTTVKLSQKYFAYKNIRYGKAPIGHLRFKPPVEAEPWSDVLDTINDGSVCPQIFNSTMMGDEDCLNLNVYTKQLPEGDCFKPKPVMFWIYGGSFKTGFNLQTLYSPDYLLEEDVVVVIINYRLGALGFLSLPHENATGNAGLKDQSLALRWVRDNIAKFGGDPNQVTIFGQSAGGASVDFQMLSPQSKGLFHKAISMSGSSIAIWAIDKPSIAQDKAYKLGKLLGSDAKTPEELLEVLYKADAHSIVEKSNEVTNLDLPFKPAIEDPKIGSNLFLTECPMKLYKSGKFNVVPHMLGYMKDETLAFIGPLVEWVKSLEDAPGFFKLFGLDINPILEAIKNNPEYVTNITIFNDLLYTAPIDYKQKLVAEFGSPVYYYRYTFSYEGSLHQIQFGVPLPGAAHSDELPMLFYSDLFKVDPKENSTRELVQRRMTRMWTNFAKFGNPTPEGNNDPLLNVTWPDSRPDGKMLEIGDTLQERDRYSTTQVRIIETSLQLQGRKRKGCVASLPRIVYKF